MNANGYEIKAGDWWVISSLCGQGPAVVRVVALDAALTYPIAVVIPGRAPFGIATRLLLFPVINPNSHNPGKLTAEQVTEGGKVPCRLLDEDEVPLRDLPVLSNIELFIHGEWDCGYRGGNKAGTFRTKLTRQELAAAREAAKPKPKERKPLKKGVLRAGMAVRIWTHQYVISMIVDFGSVTLANEKASRSLDDLMMCNAHYHNGTEWLPCWTEE